MELEELRLMPGSPVQIQFPNKDQERYMARVVGYRGHQSVLITTPRAGGRVLPVRLKQEVTVRLFSNTTACAFKTRVMNVCTTPFHYLHLAYPENIETGSIRKARRVSVRLDTTVINHQQKKPLRIQGAIVDLSTSGARIEVAEEIGDLGDQLTLMVKVPIAHVTRVVGINAVVRAQIDKQELPPGVLSYGLEFAELEEETFVVLFAFVHSQLVISGANG